jgi:hypothetical protein
MRRSLRLRMKNRRITSGQSRYAIFAQLLDLLLMPNRRGTQPPLLHL